MNTRLCYNSTDRRYELRANQRILSTHKNRQDALLAQLAEEAPQAVALAQPLIAAYPELADRALRAVALVADGAVRPNGSEGSFYVTSQQGKDSYLVDLVASTCTCMDWGQRAPEVNGRKLCKHVLAALFARKLQPNGKEAITYDRA